MYILTKHSLVSPETPPMAGVTDLEFPFEFQKIDEKAHKNNS